MFRIPDILATNAIGQQALKSKAAISRRWSAGVRVPTYVLVALQIASFREQTVCNICTVVQTKLGLRINVYFNIIYLNRLILPKIETSIGA